MTRSSNLSASVRYKPLLLHAFYAFGSGGAQTRLVRLANHFSRSLRHVIVSMNGDYSSLDRIKADVEIQPLRIAPNNDLPSRLRDFGKIIKAVQPDYIVSHNWGTVDWALPARWHGLRHVHIEDGFGPDEAFRMKRRRMMFRRLVLGKSQVVVPSLGLKQVAESSWGIPPCRLHYIPNGIDSARFPNRTRGEPPDRDLVIGTVAALRAEKNIARLIRTFAEVRSQLRCKLIIVGDGPERAVLESMVMASGMQSSVSFVGYVADPTLNYYDFDVFALSSDTEQMPYTVLEAMAAGLPVVSTDVGDIRAMVASENRQLITPPRAAELASAVVRVLRDPELRLRVGEANRLKVEQEYDISVMLAAFANLYRISSEGGT